MGNFLADLVGLGGGKATMVAAGQNANEIKAGNKRGMDYLTDGTTRANDYLTETVDQYAPLAGATNMYANAIGLNGASGNNEATTAFQAGPGYEFAVNQGLDALGRRASSLGSYQSGGTQTDFIDYSQGMANQEFGGWLDRLSGASTTALNGQGAGYNNLANLAVGDATARMQLDQDTTGSLVSNNNMYAQGKEQQSAGVAKLGGTIAGMAGRAFGYGGF